MFSCILLFSLIKIYCTNANRVLELTTLAKPSLSKLQMNDQQQWMIAGVVMIDLRKAFDVVDHKLLLRNLRYMA